MRLDDRDKEKINILLNIDNFFGDHSGRLGPIIIFLLVAVAPLIFYVFFLTQIIHIAWVVIFELLWAFRMFLLIMCKEGEKLETYLRAKNDEFGTIKQKFRITHIHDNGLMEFQNGRVGYIVTGTLRSMYNDLEFCYLMERFLQQLAYWDYDLHCQMITDEIRLQDSMDSLAVYKDREIMKERMQFYIRQDEFATSRSKLYRYCFVIKGSKDDWKKLTTELKQVVRADTSHLFETLEIADKKQTLDILSRDLCAYIDMQEMLQGKFKTENYHGSEVLFYGDEVPEEYLVKEEINTYEDGRLSE